MDVLDSLDAGQRETLDHYVSLTGNENLEQAIATLNSVGWQLELAASRAFDEPPDQPRFEPMDIDDSAQGPRTPRRAAPALNQPRGTLEQLWFRIRPLIRLLAWPLSLASSVLSLVARLLRIRPSFSTLSFGGSTSRAGAAADPTSCAERFVRSLEEQAGTRGLPNFECCGYEEALRKAQREIRPMLAILISDEHDDTPAFRRDVLSDSELLECLRENNILVWGGDIRDRDAYITSQTLEATTYPFLACIALQPPRTQPGMPALTSQSPKMTLFSRLEGPPSSLTSATAILAHLNSSFLPRISSYLNRLRAETTHRDAERRLRAEQDAAYAAAGQRDAERIAKIRAEAAAAESAEKRVRQLDQWRRWAATSLAPEPISGGARLAVKLPDGRRIVRRFTEESATVSDIYKWIEAEAFAGATEGDASYPSGYLHQYSFKVAQMIPRRSLDVDGTRTLQTVGGFSGGANLIVEGLKLGTAQDDSDEEIDDD